MSLLASLDQVCSQARANLDAYIDAYVEFRRGSFEQAPTYTPVLLPKPEPPPEPPKKPRAAHSRGLAEILDGVEDAFAALNCTDEWASSVDRDIRRGLRKLGPWIPFGKMLGERGDVLRTSIERKYLKKRPALIFLASDHMPMSMDGYNKGDPLVDAKGKQYGCAAGDWGAIAFAFAVKYAKAPWYMNAPASGDLYNFGAAYRHKGKLSWYTAPVVLTADGSVIPCPELHNRRIDIPKVGSYYRKEWMLGEYLLGYGQDNWTHSTGLDVFVRLFEWWQRRDERWTVSVRRGRDRVTWSVEQNLTKVFFKDRDKTVLTPSGQRKRIIHHVVEHERLMASGKIVPVKEHIRGLRTFNWRGFTCAITAPKFHVWTITNFTPGVVDERDLPDKVSYTPEQVGTMLANLEDRQKPHHIEPHKLSPLETYYRKAT